MAERNKQDSDLASIGNYVTNLIAQLLDQISIKQCEFYISTCHFFHEEIGQLTRAIAHQTHLLNKVLQDLEGIRVLSNPQLPNL